MIWSCNRFSLVVTCDTLVVLEVATLFKPLYELLLDYITLHYIKLYVYAP